jgi:hypothetical protein
MGEWFKHRGKDWLRIPATPKVALAVGLVVSDTSYACAVQYQRTPIDQWKESVGRNGTHCTTQQTQDSFTVLHLERMTGIFEEQAEAAAWLITSKVLANAELAVDCTFTGTLVGSLFKASKRIEILVGGLTTSVDPTQKLWTVPLCELQGALDLALPNLAVANDLLEAPALRDDLKHEIDESPTIGRAVAVAIWCATKRSRGEVSQGFVRGLW